MSVRLRRLGWGADAEMATLDPDEPSRVLLIEDTSEDEELTLRALRGCGRPLSVHVVRNGLVAQQSLGFGNADAEEGKECPDLVISDLKMPAFDGCQLLCLVRSHRRFAHLPYVIFTSSNEPSDVRRCLDCGADAFVQKPVGFHEYLDCLKTVVHWALDGFANSSFPPYTVSVRPIGAERGRGF